MAKKNNTPGLFDATPCFGATINDIDTDFIKKEYLPQIVDDEVLANDTRDIKEQLAAIHLYDLTHECPTNAAMILTAFEVVVRPSLSLNLVTDEKK